MITFHDQKSFGKMGEKAITILGTQGIWQSWNHIYFSFILLAEPLTNDRQLSSTFWLS